LYSLAPLQAILPPVHCLKDNADGSIKDARGQPLPPFVVIEKGEALNEWAKRRAPDFPTSLTVLCHVAERLQALHEAGLVHRDLKPENILWLPSRNEWTLIDFGCAAPIGEAAPLSYSIRCVLAGHYTVPEYASSTRPLYTELISSGVPFKIATAG
jgi:Protein kinase domain